MVARAQPDGLAARAVVGLWVLVMGGHTAEAGWFRQRTDTFHNDVLVLDRTSIVQWRTPHVGGDAPAPRELHSLTPLCGGRLLLFGGDLPASGQLAGQRPCPRQSACAGLTCVVTVHLSATSRAIAPAPSELPVSGNVWWLNGARAARQQRGSPTGLPIPRPALWERSQRQRLAPGGNGKDMFGDAWWLDTDNEAFQQRPGGSAAGSEAWHPRRPASVVSAPLSIASGLTGLTEDHRWGPRSIPQNTLGVREPQTPEIWGISPPRGTC